MTVGLPPGSIIYTGPSRSEDVNLSLMKYNDTQFDEQHAVSIESLVDFEDKGVVNWLNVAGVHDASIIEQLGEIAKLHPLILEDLVQVGQRPKMEEYDGLLFFVLKMLHYDGENLKVEQVSLVVSERSVISFQEYSGDVFDPVRSRLRDGKGRIRKMSADYLAYALIDTIVDHYFTVIEQIGEHIESLEEELITNPNRELIVQINTLKRKVLLLRKSIWPLREVIGALQRSESSIFKKKTEIYLRDVYDHTIQVIEMIESFRDLLSSLTDLYMSSLSQKMNEVMQFLTIVGAIFIPLTFIAGVYGMNFENMPELHWRYGYPAIIAIMVFLGIGSLFYFRRKKWL